MRSLLLIAAAAPSLALAQTPPTAPAPQDPTLHGTLAPEIVVTAPFRRSRTDLLSSVDVLGGLELTRDVRGTLGETLARQPGVSSTSFGANASRPVLRGLQGERVRVLTDGIGSFDVSNTSVDHAVAINPLLSERIEVVRGPATLLYGSSAIGGVVNALDRRIPRSVPDEPFHFDGIAGYASAPDEGFLAGALDLPLGGGFIVHADASYRSSGNLETGGFILSKPLRDEARANGLDDVAELRGELPNSDSEYWDVAGSVAWIGERASFGVAVSHYEHYYGVPIRFATSEDGEEEHGEGEEHGEEEEGHGHAPDEAVALDARQTRVDLRAGLELDGFLEEARFRFGWADYTHDELELAEGVVGTTFDNRAYEGRLELAQRKRGVWRALHGFQFLARDFNAVGAEAYVPQNDKLQLGGFTVHEFDFGALRAEAGLRYEHTSIESPVSDFNRGYDAVSVSAGLSYAVTSGLRAGINLSRNERAPAPEELLANGPHVGTQAFEIGDPDLKTEKALGAEIFLRGGTDRFAIEVAAYYTRFNDYIDLFSTGEEEDDLPVFQYIQADAKYYGFEAEISATLAEFGRWRLGGDALIDYVEAKIDDVGPAPRIPPLRGLVGLELRQPVVVARVEAELVDAQERLAGFETRTGGYTMVNASVSWRPYGPDSATSLTLALNNIGDVEARRHASFVKDFAPLAGRDVRLTARVGF